MEHLKYADVAVVFSEVPDEVALAINITGCPCHCPGCHSPWLSKDTGTMLDGAAVDALIGAHPLVTCVAFMGGDADPVAVSELCLHVKVHHPHLKTCWYSGRPLNERAAPLMWLDWYKCGPWTEALGPLNSPTTNQRMYRIVTDGTGRRTLEDATAWFRQKRFV